MASWSLTVGDQIIAGHLQDLLHYVALFQLLSVARQQVFFMVVQILHRRFQKASCEPCHVWNGAVHKELFDDLLVWEYLAEPQR